MILKQKCFTKYYTLVLVVRLDTCVFFFFYETDGNLKRLTGRANLNESTTIYFSST